MSRLRSRPVGIDGAFNARGFVSERTGRMWLVRSSALDALRPAGVSAVRDLGLRRVVDLRAPGEGGRACHEVAVLPMPLYRPFETVPAVGRLEDLMDRVIETRGEAVASAVEAIASADGPVLVHCTIGKDRTGLVVALTLLAAGVDEEDVIADYALSGAQVLPHRRDLVVGMLAGRDLAAADRADAWRLNLESPREVMTHIIDRVAAHGGATAYLRAHGLSEGAVRTLRSRR